MFRFLPIGIACLVFATNAHSEEKRPENAGGLSLATDYICTTERAFVVRFETGETTDWDQAPKTHNVRVERCAKGMGSYCDRDRTGFGRLLYISDGDDENAYTRKLEGAGNSFKGSAEVKFSHKQLYWSQIGAIGGPDNSLVTRLLRATCSPAG